MYANKGISLLNRFTSITSIDYMSMRPECQIGDHVNG